MNRKERLQMLENAGITTDDLEGYYYYLYPNQDTEEYSQEAVESIIKKINKWKHKKKV